jgi:MFS superfamily sulfate permease-like transporter
MSNEIKIALITSFTAIVVSIVSVVSNLLNNRFSRKQANVSKRNENFKKNIEAIESIIIALQVFKDTVLFLTTGALEDKEHAIKKVIMNIDSIVEKYEIAFVNMEDTEKEISHYIKNKIIHFGNTIKNKLYDLDSVKDIDADTIKLFNTFRDNISETQNILIEQKKNKTRLFGL